MSQISNQILNHTCPRDSRVIK